MNKTVSTAAIMIAIAAGTVFSSQQKVQEEKIEAKTTTFMQQKLNDSRDIVSGLAKWKTTN